MPDKSYNIQYTIYNIQHTIIIQFDNWYQSIDLAPRAQKKIFMISTLPQDLGQRKESQGPKN